MDGVGAGALPLIIINMLFYSIAAQAWGGTWSVVNITENYVYKSACRGDTLGEAVFLPRTKRLCG
jgi:hypothetical protein